MTFKHGASAYKNHRCRCEICREANTAKLAAWRARQPAGEFTHGVSGYTNHRCRCEVCTEAHRAYNRAHYQASKRRHDDHHGRVGKRPAVHMGRLHPGLPGAAPGGVVIRRAAWAVAFAAGVVLGTGLMIFAKLASERIEAAEMWADRITQGRGRWADRHLPDGREDGERDRLAGR